MELYKTFRNFALIGALGILPYVCEQGCAYSKHKIASIEPVNQETICCLPGELENKIA
jgi:hypothetical protein